MRSRWVANKQRRSVGYRPTKVRAYLRKNKLRLVRLSLPTCAGLVSYLADYRLRKAGLNIQAFCIERTWGW